MLGLGDSVTEWFSCRYLPALPGWYDVQRFTEDQEPVLPEVQRLFWCSGWFYDPDCLLKADMNIDNGDVWRARTHTVM